MTNLPKLTTLAVVLGAALLASPSFAALEVGSKAPRFEAPAYLAGEPFTYELDKALKKGPVVVYFFPAPHTSGCNVEAHLFSEAIDDFKAQGATVIGVTAGKLDELADFSKETEHCGGQVPGSCRCRRDNRQAIRCPAGAETRMVQPDFVRDLAGWNHRACVLGAQPQGSREGNAGCGEATQGGKAGGLRFWRA
jgi:hypothetical protein